MNLDLEWLEQLAREATQIGRRWWGASTLQYRPPLGRRDAAYIASASPDVVLALIERVRTAEAGLGAVRAYCEAYVEESGETDPEPWNPAAYVLAILDGTTYVLDIPSGTEEADR